MRIFSVAWGWTLTPEDMPQDDSLEVIAREIKELGFEGVDYLSTYESLDSYFDEEACTRISATCQSLGLEIGGLVFQSDVWNNPDPMRQQQQLDYFAKCVQAASWLGARAISCIIPRPFGATGPRRNASPSEKTGLKLPSDYRWQEDWDLFATMLRKASILAEEKDLTIALECFPGSLCSTPHAMMKIIEDVGMNNFGIQLDTAHLMNQSIDIATAIHMLGAKNIKNVHFKDSDGMSRGNLPAGCGLVNYENVISTLNHVGYTGSASIEVEFTDNPRRYMKQALDHIHACLDGTY